MGSPKDLQLSSCLAVKSWLQEDLLKLNFQTSLWRCLLVTFLAETVRSHNSLLWDPQTWGCSSHDNSGQSLTEDRGWLCLPWHSFASPYYAQTTAVIHKCIRADMISITNMSFGVQFCKQLKQHQQWHWVSSDQIPSLRNPSSTFSQILWEVRSRLLALCFLIFFKRERQYPCRR